jgi:hypothetical protein
MRDLRRLEDRIHRHKHSTGGGSPERRAHGLKAFFHVHRNALAAPQSQSDQTASNGGYGVREMREIKPLRLVDQCRCGWRARRTFKYQLVQ